MNIQELKLKIHYINAMVELYDKETGRRIPIQSWSISENVDGDEGSLTVEIPLYFVDIEEVKQHD